VLAALTLSTGFALAPQAHAQAPSSVPAKPLDRDGEISRDDTRPALLPEVARALNQRQVELSETSVEIAVAERTQQVNEFAQQRAKAEQATRYAERVKQLGYDPLTTDPRDIAKKMMLDEYQWGEDEFTCVDKIWTQESNWQWNAENPTSGAYGIPQSLPASKLASAGDDWKTNPATQIKWGLKYIQDRYGTPCSAWGFKSGHGWY
jgi:hypothetical protein